MSKMKSIFKIILVSAAMIALAAASTGCGDSGKNDVATQGQKTQKEIKIFIPGYDEELWKGLYDAGINDFKDENPDVAVTVIPSGWDEANANLVSLIQANETPDVIITGSRSLRQLAEMVAVEKLDVFMSGEFKSQRVENVLNTANIKGNQYGIPLAFSSRALYYRSDLIKKAPKDWNQLLSTATAVKSKNPGIYGFAIPTDITSGTDELFNFIYQNAGSATDDNGNIQLVTDANVKTLDYLKKFNDKKLIPDPVTMKRSDQAALFQSGKLAMFISGPWEKKKLDETSGNYPYAVAMLPKGVNMAETLVTDSFSMSSQTKYKEDAWKLIEFMGKYKYQNAYDEAIGFFPVLKEEEKEKRYDDKFLKPFNDMIQYGVPEPQVPVWDTFNSEFTAAVQKVLTGKETSKEALQKAEKQINK